MGNKDTPCTWKKAPCPALERPGLLSNPNPPWVRILARLKPDITLTQLHANALLVFHQTLRESAGLRPTPESVQDIEREP